MHGLRPAGLWIAAFALSMGCGEKPARDAGPATPATPPTPPAEPEVYAEHTVEEGQTLWDIARAYGVTVDDVMETNDLTPRDVRRLSKGRVLRIPGVTEARAVTRVEAVRVEDLPPLENGAYHILAEGETLWDLARTYDKPMDEIVAANQLTDDDVRALRPGRPIAIPGIRPSDVRRTEPSETRRSGITHTVAPGETLWDLAQAFHVSAAELMAANGLDEVQVTRLRDGTRLFIPGVERDRAGEVRRGLSDRQRRALAYAQRLGLGTRQVASRLLAGRVEPRWMRAAGGVDRLPGTLRWPVTNGRFVRGFGSGEGGYHQAVDIAGDIGWNVRAAAPGIVAYSGDEVPGYGNLVLVVHPGGWVTMYAHNSVNFVVAGEEVPRGAVLAELGSTGISRGPHVHFELMFGGRNCDPATLFRPGVRHRSRLARIAPQTWNAPGNKPSVIQCGGRRRHPRSRWVIHEDPGEDAEAESDAEP